jgi:hypothetical protein
VIALFERAGCCREFADDAGSVSVMVRDLFCRLLDLADHSAPLGWRHGRLFSRGAATRPFAPHDHTEDRLDLRDHIEQ